MAEDASTQRTPTLVGMTSWSAGLRLPEDGDAEAQPGKYIVKILFDDPAQLSAWCNWIMDQDAAWRGGADAMTVQDETPAAQTTDAACYYEAFHAYRQGWQAANHSWQEWLDKNIPDWDAMAGIDLTTLPREPK